MVGAFSCYSVVTLHLLNKINVIKVVIVTLEIFKLDKHSCNKQEHFIPYIYAIMCLREIYYVMRYDVVKSDVCFSRHA